MSGAVTLSKALSVFAKELGCSVNGSRELLTNIVTRSVEYLLLNGGGDILREWKLPVSNGRTTLPRDLRTPVKYRISAGCCGVNSLGAFSSPYFRYSSNSVTSCCGYNDWDPQFSVSPNYVYTQYKLPSYGARLLATTTDERDVGKHLVVSGVSKGFVISPTHNGIKTSGELLPIFHIDDPDKKLSAWEFDDITGVTKDETCNYVMLSAFDTQDNVFHLSYYTPDEITPQYTEINLQALQTYGREFTIEILGRVNPSIEYLRDEDIIPIDSFEILNILAKRARYDESGNYTEVANMENRLKRLINQYVSYQAAPNRYMSIKFRGSSGSLTNM